MTLNKLIRPVSFVLIILYFASCTTTFEVTRRSELTIPDDFDELHVRTKDNKFYTIEHYRLDDSVLTFTGSVVTGDSEKPVSGKLKLSEITEIQAKETSLGKTILVIGAAAAVIGIFIAFLDKENGLHNDVVIKYPAGGGCVSLNDRLPEENMPEPIAAGFKNVIGESSPCFMYLEISHCTGIYYFKIVNDVDVLMIEPLDESSSNFNITNKIIVDLVNLKH
jgi:hypothetical protein